MGEAEIGRIIERFERFEQQNEKRHREVMISLTRLEADQEHQQEDLAKNQEAVADMMERLNQINVERAGEKGKLAGICIASAILGNVIMVILSRTGVLDALFGK